MRKEFPGRRGRAARVAEEIALSADLAAAVAEADEVGQGHTRSQEMTALLNYTHQSSSPRPAAPSWESLEPLLERLYRKHREFLKRQLRAATLGDCALTDDVIHDTFERLADNYGERIAQMTDAQVAGLLKTIGHNCLVDRWRKDAKLAFWQSYSESAVPMDGVPASDTEHIDRLVNEEFAIRLSRVAEKVLTRGEWWVVYMGVFMGKPDADIAQELGTTIRTVRTHRSAACRKLRPWMKKDGDEIVFMDPGTGQSSSTPGGIGEVTV
ncbi:RNA polymerase sigma factor [Nocardia pseudobrasiliensis]|uniref:DNA-directed RNA polymerase specialized sigma24 family protein n=1 Tax=Nocardia pseudobrasiliensis TaxID=45979 RepID=A0A370I7X5_9NOCA|nr:RNA polymerase sigma factor [Nocardia pseudobrasiliensis]RDI66819.1 DNA-directed RNA polymerase specialized sigma24 family protein [Nocardia pseudobrasiliensis]